MAKGEEITTKFKVDVSDLKKGISEANKNIKMANAEFKAASSGMDDWTKSSEGLNAKLKQLHTVLNEQVTKLKNYKDQLKEIEKAESENGKRADELKKKLQELANQGVLKTSDEYKKYEKALSDCEKEQLANQSAADKLRVTILNQQAEVNKTNKEMRNYKTTLDQVESDTKNLDGSTDKLDKELKDIGSSAKTAGDGFTVMKGALANLVADGLRRAVDATKEFAKSMIDTAATVKAENSQFEQTFGDMASTAEAAIKRVANSTGILDSRLKTTGAQIFAFARSSGATVPEAMALMETSLMASADSAAYYDKSLEESAETLQSFLKGNYANDAALGVSSTEFTRNSKAVELFGKKYNDLSEIQKQQTLLKMVTDAQQLSGAMGQAAREADGWENVQGNLNETWRQFKASVGTPFLEALIPVIQQVTTSFKEWANSVDWNGFSIKVKKAIDTIINVFKWFIENKTIFISAISGMIAAFAVVKIASFASAVAGLITTLTSAPTIIAGVTAALKAMNLTALANPYVALAAGIAAVGTALVVWNKNSNSLENQLKKEVEATERERQAVEANKQAYDELNQTKQNAINNGMSEMQHYENLFNELSSLVDANGKVKEGYEGRANFIVTTLNDALGLEIKMVDNQISKYDELKGTFDKVMEKKKAMIILDAEEEGYKTAIQHKSEALQKFNELEETLYQKRKERDQAQTEWEEIMNTKGRNVSFQRLSDAKDRLDALNKEVDETGKAYDAQERLLEEYAYNIAQYEGNMAKVHEEKYDEISNVNFEYVDNLKKADDQRRELTQAQLKDEETNLNLLKELKERNNTDIYDNQIKASEQLIEKLKSDLDAQSEAWRESLGTQLSEITGKQVEFKKAGEGQVEMFIDGVSAGTPDAEYRMKSFAEAMVTNLKAAKPGAQTAGQNVLEGFNLGLNDQNMKRKIKVTSKGVGQETLETLQESLEEHSPSKATDKMGQYLLDGIRNGIDNQNKRSGIFNSIASFGSKILARLKNSLEEKSPSKATQEMGQFLLDGLGIGIDDKENSVLKQITEVGKNIVSTLKDELSETIEIPKINTKNLQLAKANLSRISNGLRNELAGGVFGANKTTTSQNVVNNFNQVINAPKSPSRIEIYRQTRNLLDLKGRG